MVHVTKVEVTDEDMTVSDDDVRSTSHSSESTDSTVHMSVIGDLGSKSRWNPCAWQAQIDVKPRGQHWKNA